MNEFAAPGFGDRRKESLIAERVVVINHEEQYLKDASRESKTATVSPDVCKDSPFALDIGLSAPEFNGIRR